MFCVLFYEALSQSWGWEGAGRASWFLIIMAKLVQWEQHRQSLTIQIPRVIKYSANTHTCIYVRHFTIVHIIIPYDSTSHMQCGQPCSDVTQPRCQWYPTACQWLTHHPMSSVCGLYYDKWAEPIKTLVGNIIMNKVKCTVAFLSLFKAVENDFSIAVSLSRCRTNY